MFYSISGSIALETPMTNIKFTFIVTLLLSATVAGAADDGAMMEKPSIYASQSRNISAVVQMIDHETRVVTLRRADGVLVTITASEDVRNLDQVSVGDVLYAEYEHTVSIEVKANEGMEPDAAEISAIARTDKGEMPGAMAVDAMVIRATVEEINIEANTFKLKGPDGTISEYVAQNPENLKRASVGDLVIITVSESVAITVEKRAAE
jgi:hypothetical protein